MILAARADPGHQGAAGTETRGEGAGKIAGAEAGGRLFDNRSWLISQSENKKFIS